MTNWDEIESPVILAWRLWDAPHASEVQALEPARFQELFDRVYSSTSDPKALWRLGGAANDYQRFHNIVINVPIALPRLLLASRNKDSRIIGLKLLTRSIAPDEEIVGAICRALHRRDGYESSGGVHELTMFLDRRYPTGSLPAPELVQSLIAEIEPLANDRTHARQSKRCRRDLAASAARQLNRLKPVAC